MQQKNQSFGPFKKQNLLSLQQISRVTGGEASTDHTSEEEPVPLAGISNVLKTKHDTAKNSVGNIR